MSLYDDKSIRDAILGPKPIAVPPAPVTITTTELAKEIAAAIANQFSNRVAAVFRVISDDLDLTQPQKDLLLERMAAAWDEEAEQ